MGLFSDPQPEPVVVGGLQLLCHHCRHDSFFSREAQLNTAGASFLGLDWLNRSAQVYVCASCAHLHWFLER